MIALVDESSAEVFDDGAFNLPLEHFALFDLPFWKLFIKTVRLSLLVLLLL